LGFLSRIFAKRETSDPRYPGARRVPYTGRTQAGIYVTPDTALQNATVWAGHRYLTQVVGQLPARIMRANGAKGEQIFAHPVDNVLNWRTNPELSPYQFKETMVGWALLWGNAVAEIERDVVGRVVNLWPLHPNRVHFRRDAETGELLYFVSNGYGFEFSDMSVGTVVLRPMDVFHIRGFGDGPVGLSVVEYAAQSIGWARAAELFGASFFGEGMHFGGAAILPGKADADTVKRVRTELEQAHRGPNRAGKWFVGDQSMKLEKMTVTPEEGQFNATMNFQVEELCRWMGVPPQKVYHLLRMTNNNVEHLSIEVVVDSITPWALRFEEECNFKLFGTNRKNLFVKLDLKGLLRGDFISRQTGLQVMRRNGVINADDWAELEDMRKPGKAGGGETYIVEGNMTRLDQVGSNMQNVVVTTPEPPPEPLDDDVEPGDLDSAQPTEAAQAARIAVLAGLEPSHAAA
jgi:HK97 family phage portal protein